MSCYFLQSSKFSAEKTVTKLQISYEIPLVNGKLFFSCFFQDSLFILSFFHLNDNKYFYVSFGDSFI